MRRIFLLFLDIPVDNCPQPSVKLLCNPTNRQKRTETPRTSVTCMFLTFWQKVLNPAYKPGGMRDSHDVRNTDRRYKTVRKPGNKPTQFCQNPTINQYWRISVALLRCLFPERKCRYFSFQVYSKKEGREQYAQHCQNCQKDENRRALAHGEDITDINPQRGVSPALFAACSPSTIGWPKTDAHYAQHACTIGYTGG